MSDLLLADDTLNMSTSPSGSGEPPTKRQKTDDETLDQSQTQSIKVEKRVKQLLLIAFNRLLSK